MDASSEKANATFEFLVPKKILSQIQHKDSKGSKFQINSEIKSARVSNLKIISNQYNHDYRSSKQSSNDITARRNDLKKNPI